MNNQDTLNRFLHQDLTDPHVALDLIRFCERAGLERDLCAAISDPKTISRLAWTANTHWPVHFSPFVHKFRAAQCWHELMREDAIPYTLAVEYSRRRTLSHDPTTKPVTPADILHVLDGLAVADDPKPAPQKARKSRKPQIIPPSPIYGSLSISETPRPPTPPHIYGDLILTPTATPPPYRNPSISTHGIKISFPSIAVFIALAIICPDPPQAVKDALKTVETRSQTPFTDLLSPAGDLSFLTQLVPALLNARLTFNTDRDYRTQLAAIYDYASPLPTSAPWIDTATKFNSAVFNNTPSPDPPTHTFWHRAAISLLGENNVRKRP